MNDPRLHTEGAENTFTHEVLREMILYHMYQNCRDQCNLYNCILFISYCSRKFKLLHFRYSYFLYRASRMLYRCIFYLL